MRRLRNWSYRNVTDFLREKGFTFCKEVGGSHQTWIKYGDNESSDTIVGLHFTHGSYPPKTMRGIIRKSGIDEHEWANWSQH